MENKEVTKKFKKLRNMKQYKDKTDDEIMALAEESLRKEALDSSEGSWVNESEKTQAEELYNKYLESYNLTSASDREGLKNLVFYEIFAQRLQKIISKKSVDEKGEFQAPGKNLMEALNNANEQIVEWKERLGLFENKTENDGFTLFQILKKKVLDWFYRNPNIPYLPCPYCQGDLYIKLREPQLYEAVKHPLFKDKILWNDALLEYVHEGKLTVEEVARVLETSATLISLMLDKKYNKQAPKIEGAEEKC
jgi:hypothetical protein